MTASPTVLHKSLHRASAERAETGISQTTLSSRETAVNLPSWWSNKVAAASWEIPPGSLHLDPSPFTHTFKDTWQTLWQSSIMPEVPPRQHTHYTESSCLGGLIGSRFCVSVCLGHTGLSERERVRTGHSELFRTWHGKGMQFVRNIRKKAIGRLFSVLSYQGTWFEWPASRIPATLQA